MSTMSPAVVEATGAPVQDLDAIARVVGYYAEGLRHGSVETLQKAFHPQAVMSGYFNQDLLLVPMEGFFDLVRTVPAPAKSGEPFRHEIKSVQVTGDMATVEIAEFCFLGHDFKTCFHMIRVDGRWQITSKLFSTLGPSRQG